VAVTSKSFCLILCLLTGLASLAAFDFGLITNQYVDYGYEDGEKFEYKADILPRFSFLVGENGEFLLSAGITLGTDDGFYYILELLRTELTMRFGGSSIKAGRIYYADPLSFIAGGLFDGLQFSHNTPTGIFSAGVWYTGLLYKETANITMTANDMAIYKSALNYDDLANTYFAPKRVLASMDWGHPSVAERFSLKTALAGQIDLSDADEKLHSQYLTIKTSIPVKRFSFDLGGSIEIVETATEDKTQFNMAFAGDLGIFWTLPAIFHSRLSFGGHFAGGRVDDFIGAFVPVTTKVFGNIFQPKLSGLTILDLNYTARLSRVIGANLSALHFIRNDLGTFNDYPIKGSSDNYFLGTEFFGRLIWSPFSDWQFNFGGGAFLPSLGDVSDEKPQWRVELTAVFAIL